MPRTDADVIAANKRFAEDDDDASDPIDDAIFAIEFDALSFNDGAGLADDIIDEIITVLRRAFHHTSHADWEKILADCRIKLAEELGDYIDGMVDAKTAIRTIRELGDVMKPTR